jgi:surface polysaccharide O-acyltransferase-like enzyme
MYIIDGLIYTASRLLSVYALIGLGNCFFNSNSKVLGYLSKASFTVYVIHMLVMTIIGYFIVALPIPVTLMFILILVGTFLISFLFYEVAKRVRILKLLIGIKG